MAFAAMAGMLGARLEWAQPLKRSRYAETAGMFEWQTRKTAFEEAMTEQMALLVEQYKNEQHRMIYGKSMGAVIDVRS
jgi:hypothetical protein